MALATYANLKTAVASWLNRADLTSAIPDFITIAHKQLMRDLRGHVRMQKRDPAFSISAEYVAVPSDFLEVVSMYLTTSTKQEILMLPSEGATAAYSSGSGIPKFYTLVAPTTQGTEMFRFVPPPDSTYTAELQYYASLTAMSADADYNWILTDHPTLYLYGSLAASRGYIIDDGRLQDWENRYKQELAAVMAAGRKARWASSGMMVRAW